MSDLLEQIKVDQLTARKAGDSFKATVLTTLLGEASPSGKETVTDAQVQAVVKKFVKNINEIISYVDDSVKLAVSQQEIEILENYLPKQIEGICLENLIFDLINSDGCDNMGKLMKALNGAFTGQFDGKEASKIAKTHLEL